MRLIALALPLALLGAPAGAQNRTWIVDINSGPGTDFTDIAPAVAAAGPRDKIIVRSGLYGPFAASKPLTILGEGTVTVQKFGTDAVVVTGLPPNQAFIMKNVGVRFLGSIFPFGGGVLLENNAGRVHFEDVRVESAAVPSNGGIACNITDCTQVTWAGGAISAGGPSLLVTRSTISFSDVSVSGNSACNHSLCAAIRSGVAMSLRASTAFLSRTDLQGGFGATHMFFTNPPSVAIQSVDSSLTITGDSQTRIAAGELTGGQPLAAIEASGGSLDVDTSIVVQGAQGGPPIVATNAVMRPILSLTGTGSPPGGAVSVEVVSPAGDPLFVALGLPGNPLPTAFGTLFLNSAAIIPVYMGNQQPNGRVSVSIPVPSHQGLRGGVVPFQAATLYSSTPRLEFSNVTVLILH